MLLEMGVDKYRDQEDIVTLLKCYLEGGVDDLTHARIEEWLRESEKNRELFERVRSREVLTEKIRFYEQVDMNEDWKVICRKTEISSSRLRFMVRRFYRYAAVVVGMGLIVGLLYTGWNKESAVLPLAGVVVQDSILPGFRQAFIVLANGERIRLGDTLQRVEKEVDGGRFMEGSEGLVVTASGGGDVEKTRFNKLEVPKGGEYELVLADGTKVWLNSDSELEFPLAFNGEKRLVRLKGEAYFEVKHDDRKSFEVCMDGMTVVVLGTSFNAFAYDGVVNTTLVKGSVEVHAKGGNYKLIPGEQASLMGGKVRVEKVDVAEQIGWKEGKFIFRSKRLEEVMVVLARWYNLEVVYQNDEVKNLHFTGNIPRHATVSELLSVLERTHLVRFTVQGRSVLVSK